MNAAERGPLTVDEVRAFVEGLGGVLTLAPGPGDGTPEIAWGDLFFYEAPDGVLPPGQPFATVVTKDYPGEPSSRLDRPGSFRVNVGASRAEVGTWSGPPEGVEAGTPDVVQPHPAYGPRAGCASSTRDRGRGSTSRPCSCRPTAGRGPDGSGASGPGDPRSVVAPGTTMDGCPRETPSGWPASSSTRHWPDGC